jgi:hypothetical protein
MGRQLEAKQRKDEEKFDTLRYQVNGLRIG